MYFCITYERHCCILFAPVDVTVVFMQHLSTSPAQEPDYFESHVRAAFSLLHAHPQPNETLFKDNAPRLYRKTMAGSWVKVS